MNTRHAIEATPRRERGVAALSVALLLLSTMALIALFANRSLLIEQKSSANQYRATRAFEMAEAGIEWATAMLNEARLVDASCVAAAAGLSFRDRYVPSDALPALAPATTVRPSCRVTGAALACSCPEPSHNPLLGAIDDPSFGVAFAAVPTDADAVQLTAWGCTGQGTQCVPGSTQGRSDAVAQVSVVLKLKPLLRALPVAPLTAGGKVSIGGPASLVNLDVGSQGNLVVTGQSIDVALSATLSTLRGAPAANALLANDATLNALLQQGSDGGAVFNAFFGMSVERFKNAAPVRVISGGSSTERTTSLRSAYDQGYSAFFVDGDLLFDAAGVGSAARPVLIVSASAVACSAPCSIHGMLYADVAQRDASDLANVNVEGAVVTRGHHAQPLGGAIAYDAGVLKRLRRQSAVLVRVPGSWRDF